MSIPAVLHPHWCSHHEFTGPLDTWHRSRPWKLQTAASLIGDPDSVEVVVEQYADRTATGLWVSRPASVALNGLRRGGSDLTAHESRQVAQALLRASDVVDGLAVAV